MSDSFPHVKVGHIEEIFSFTAAAEIVDFVSPVGRWASMASGVVRLAS